MASSPRPVKTPLAIPISRYAAVSGSAAGSVLRSIESGAIVPAEDVPIPRIAIPHAPPAETARNRPPWPRGATARSDRCARSSGPNSKSKHTVSDRTKPSRKGDLNPLDKIGFPEVLRLIVEVNSPRLLDVAASVFCEGIRFRCRSLRLPVFISEEAPSLSRMPRSLRMTVPWSPERTSLSD